MRDPDMGDWTYEYDQAGNLTKQTDAKNQVLCFTYDALNRRTQKNYGTTTQACGTNAVVYTYDDLTPGNHGIGRLKQVTDASGTVTFAYDPMSRIKQSTKTLDGTDYVTQSTYDGLGRLVTVTYPGTPAKTVSYDYDGPWLKRVYEVGGTTYAQYSGWNALGQIASTTFGNGVTTTNTYAQTSNSTCPQQSFRLCTLKTTGPMTGGSSNTLSFTPEADTYLNEAFPTSNFGDADHVEVSGQYQGSWKRNAYLRFNVTGVPVSATITSVTLTVVNGGYSGSESVDSGTIYKWSPNNTTWPENLPTWNNMAGLEGSFGSGPLGSLGAVAVGQPYTFTNLQSAVSGNGRVNFVLISTNEDGAGYFSREAAQPPLLQVTYTAGGTPGAAYQDFRYTYDNEGNVLDIYDQLTSAKSQHLNYDDLDRLLTANGPYGSGGANSTITYSYDEIGNLTENSQVGTYTYPLPDGPNTIRPHAVIGTGTGSGLSGVVAAYSFSEGMGTTTADSAGSNTATLINAAWTTQGKYGAGLSFNGTNAYVEVPTPAIALQFSSAFTVEAWVKLNTLPNDWTTILGRQYGTGTGDSWWIGTNGATLYFYAGSDSVSTPIATGVWLHVAAVKNGTTLTLYFNGFEMASITNAAATILNDANEVTFGAGSNGNPLMTEFFNGTLDEIRFYNRALTPSEIQVDVSRPISSGDGGVAVYSYDANGNLISGAGRTISYNAENKPISITANGQTTTFVYDGDGGRVKKIAGTTTTRYIGKLYECDNTSCTRFIFAGNTRIATVTVNTGAVHYWHQDHLGSSSVITDSAGALVQTLAYYPYGATRANQSSANPAVDVPYKYTGKELDSTTGLYYYAARYYDPALGRFISADTIVPNPRDPQELNRYTYAGNNPFKYTDPTGHFKLAKVLDRIFENKFLRIAGWVLFPQQMVFVDPSTRRYTVPAAAGSAGYLACASVGLGAVCGGAAAGAASALVSQSEGRGGNVWKSTLAGGAAGAAGSFATGIIGCSTICGGAAAGTVYAAIMGGDLRKGAIRGAIGGGITAVTVLGIQYSASGVASVSQDARDSSSMNVDQSSLATPVAELGGRCITPGGNCLVSGTLSYNSATGEYDVAVRLLPGVKGPVYVDAVGRPVVSEEGYLLGRIDLGNHEVTSSGVIFHAPPPPADVYGGGQRGYIELFHAGNKVYQIGGYHTRFSESGH
ncbi:MAG: DNRLRE domain-containing protein [Nitrospiraceae bacterium]